MLQFCAVCGLCCSQAVVFFLYSAMFVYFVGCFAVAKMKGQLCSVKYLNW